MCTIVLGGYALFLRTHERAATTRELTDTVAAGAIARAAPGTTSTAAERSPTRDSAVSEPARAAARIAQLLRTRRPATPSPANELASFLPAELAGYRTVYEPRGGVVQNSGVVIARGDATYERGKAIVRVSVTDAAFQSPLYPTAVLAGEMRADTANGAGSLGLLLDGAVGHEMFDMHTGMYELHMVVADRYVVDIASQRGLMPDEGRAIFRTVNRSITPTLR